MTMTSPKLVKLLTLNVCFAAALSAETTREIERSFDLHPERAVVIDVTSGDIVVQGADVTTVSMQLTLIADTDNEKKAAEMFDKMELQFEDKDDYLRLRARPESKSGWNWSWRGGNYPEVKMVVSVPHTYDVIIDGTSADSLLADLEGDISVDMTSGTTVARNIKGRLKIDNTSGEMTVIGAHGDIIIDGTSADATVVDSSGKLLFDSTSGSLATTRFAGTVNADTTSGDLYVQLSTVPNDKMRFDTVSGDVQLTMLAPNEGSLEATTTSGDIDIKLDAGTAEQRDDDDVMVVFGQGGERIRIDTVSGDITVRPFVDAG